ncbi:MAG TPA: hypothetical protein DEA96_17695 [Leptospiraceae bacterium]|nr:hypothetical protein [Leptospiraceae bacterium]
MIGTDLRILYESVDLYWSDLSFYWLLVCLFITFSVFALRAISSRGMRLDPTMWLALGITPLLWYLFPTFHSSEIELKLDSQKLRYIKGTKARILDLADVRYVECKTPGTGIAIYKEDPEAIAWSEIANLYPPGPLEPDKNMHPLKLAGVGFRTGGAALRLFHESVRIDTGNLTAVERVILCDALGNLARKARQRFSFYE